MLFDTHTHCEYSTDSKMKITEAIAAAEKSQIGLTVTEHCDFDYPTNPEAFVFDVEDYLTKFQGYRSPLVLLGVELGLQEQVLEQNQSLVKQYNLDCIIGSIHCVHGRDLYEPKAYRGLTKKEALQEYLEVAITNFSIFDGYNIVGHIDYICRYMPYEDTELYYEEFPALWDELFKRILDKEKVLEINTRRLGEPKAVETLTILYQRYRELGGRFVSIGSDAHYKEHVGRNLKLAKQIATTCDLQTVHFQERQMIID
ncbi:MAG TPA: histidinol-phosphatase HisJ family protein [Candidatus Avacidaminococcus intestinavium]|uniref:Histidinol-phosphatase n=1 Tax=Candidatus Avacidaminococcus intestinavium TaxID=2840684 RepID=A0A9D1SKV5_9FIRM|nr:histidinol-phosphatase HisJ family protein [Candidatus Avacidaminococcus intestinavium]